MKVPLRIGRATISLTVNYLGCVAPDELTKQKQFWLRSESCRWRNHVSCSVSPLNATKHQI